jgi:hypothetical protein
MSTRNASELNTAARAEASNLYALTGKEQYLK